MPRVLIPMADYGHDPTEVAVPFKAFKEAGFEVNFATEAGKTPQCDRKMLEGMTGSMLGADAAAKAAHDEQLVKSAEYNKPQSWSEPDFSMDAYDLVFLPGGHEKRVRQIIESKTIHSALVSYFAKCSRAGKQGKVLAGICHGIQVLAFAPAQSSPNQTFPLDKTGCIDSSIKFKSVIHECQTTALTSTMEGSIFQLTRLVLGDYYKTFGRQSPNVEDYVKYGLDDASQFKPGPGLLSGKMGQPFVVVDDKYRYVSGRFPPDAKAVADKAIELVKEASMT